MSPRSSGSAPCRPGMPSQRAAPPGNPGGRVLPRGAFPGHPAGRGKLARVGRTPPLSGPTVEIQITAIPTHREDGPSPRNLPIIGSAERFGCGCANIRHALAAPHPRSARLGSQAGIWRKPPPSHVHHAWAVGIGTDEVPAPQALASVLALTTEATPLVSRDCADEAYGLHATSFHPEPYDVHPHAGGVPGDPSAAGVARPDLLGCVDGRRGRGHVTSPRRARSTAADQPPAADSCRAGAWASAHSRAWSATASQPGAPHVQWSRPANS